MTASATGREAREDTSNGRLVSLQIDFSAFEAFHAETEPPEDDPRIVRWFGCFARGEYETA